MTSLQGVLRSARSTPRKSARVRRSGLGYFLGFGAPGLLFYACFVFAPLVLSLGYSFTNADAFLPHTKFTGLHNYVKLLGDPDFRTQVRVTTILTLIIVIVPNVAGLAVAVLLNRNGRLYRALRTVFSLGDFAGLRQSWRGKATVRSWQPRAWVRWRGQ